MIAFVFQTGNSIRLSYTTDHDIDSTYIGCGQTMDDLWNVVRPYMTRDDFREAYQNLLHEKTEDWESNPFERMKKNDFMDHYKYEKEGTR